MNTKGSKYFKLLVIVLMMGVVIEFFILHAPVSASNVSQELEIDTKLGLLERPWKINLIRIATRDYLRNQAKPITGLHATLDRMSPIGYRGKSSQTVNGLNPDVSGPSPVGSSPDSGSSGFDEVGVTVNPSPPESPPSTPTGFGTD